MRRLDLGTVRVAALCVCAAGAWGCAANEAASPAPAAPAASFDAREPATIEEAQAELERARAQLPGWAGPATPSGPHRQLETEPDRCGHACGAVTSMRHAVEAICRMAGESDARCTDGRRTLKDSEAKVATCGCPAP
jgi:hypothetical protein